MLRNGYLAPIGTLVAAVALCGAACGGSSSTGGDGGAVNGDGSAVDLDGGTSDAGVPSASCAERGANLPARTGNDIQVRPAGPGMVTLGATEQSLRQVVADAEPGDTVLLEDGVYTFPEAAPGNYTGLYFTKPNVTLRSLSGNAESVVLDSAYADHGDSTGAITIDASGVVLADFTVRRSIFHLVHLQADADDVIVHNLHMLDGGQQFLKSSPGNAATVDNVEVSCSAFRMTASGRDNVWGYGAQDGSTRCYTGGIDSHGGRDWNIHDNLFEGIYCDATGTARPAHGKKGSLRGDMSYQGGLSEHAIHMWDSEQGSSHTITKNQILNCARGIGLGLQDEVYGGVITNNMIFSEHEASSEHDVGIIVERGHNTLIANNSIYYSSANSYLSAIEYRWAESSGLQISNNLSNRQLRARDSATATLNSNVIDAQPNWFAAPASGDLHLASCTQAELAGVGQVLSEVGEDFDSEARMAGNDIGADQCF